MNTADIYFLMGRNEIEIHYEEKVNVNSYLLYCNNEHIFHFQLILKGNFSVFNSPKTNKLENVNIHPSLLGQKFFVRFLGELKKPKSPFEIN